MSVITNTEVLAVNQKGEASRQIFGRKGQRIWISTDSETGDKFVALFNLNEKETEIVFDLELDYLRNTYKVRDLWAREDIGTVDKKLEAKLPLHGAGLFRLSKMH